MQNEWMWEWMEWEMALAYIRPNMLGFWLGQTMAVPLLGLGLGSLESPSWDIIGTTQKYLMIQQLRVTKSWLRSLEGSEVMVILWEEGYSESYCGAKNEQ